MWHGIPPNELCRWNVDFAHKMEHPFSRFERIYRRQAHQCECYIYVEYISPLFGVVFFVGRNHWKSSVQRVRKPDPTHCRTYNDTHTKLE